MSYEPEYAIVDEYIYSNFESDEPIYLLLAEEDGTTMTYSPSVVPDADDFADIFHGDRYKRYHKNGEGLSDYMNGMYMSGKYGKYTGTGRHEYDEALEAYMEKYPDTTSRFFGA